MRIGIDFGGTKTEVIGLHARNGKELFRHRVQTHQGDYDATIKSFVDLVSMAEEATKMTGTVGVAIPGPIYPHNGRTGCPNTPWVNDHPFKDDLEKALGRDIRMENDANCFAVSEATDGAAAGKDVVFGVIIGTGCGGGLFVNGKVVRGANGIAGEWGHNPLPFQRVYAPNGEIENPFHFLEHKEKDFRPKYITDDIRWAEYPGEVSFCGRRGQLDDWISGRGLKMDYNRVTGEELSTHDIIENARRGEEKASHALERYCDRLARSLAYVINILDPDVIVLGGGMSNVDYLYKRVPELWREYIYSDHIATELKPPRHGDSSGVRGAAWLWPKDE